MLSYWLPCLIDSLDEVNTILLHRQPPLVLNGREALLLRALSLSQEFLHHLERLHVRLPEVDRCSE